MKQKPKAKPQVSKGKNTKPKAGLSFSEKKRLKELQRTLAGNHKEQEKPTTAQNTITFKKMFRDGICQVTSEFYTKMVEFYDINYDLLEIEDQGEILEEYSKLINYFDPSIRFELFLFNRQVNEQTLIDQFDIPLQGDDFDDIREEYTEMLKNQAAKGNNGIIKSKYLIFGTECKGYKEAKSKLNNIEKDVIKNLLNLGTHAKSLDGKERLRILHEYFNQDTMEPFRFSFKELAESGKSVKDYIAPPGFDFRYPSRFKAGRMYGSVHYLDIIAPRFNDELLKKLLDIDDNLTITMHVETVVLLSQQKPDDTIEIDLDLDELDATAAETKATYEEIKAYVWEKHHLKVSSLYISQIKRKCGLEVGQNYNLSKSENPKVPKCPPEKEAAIMDALKHFQMI